MKETAKTPPRWMESLLERLLPAHTGEQIVGDLREEYIESMLPRRGRLRANLWYARHALSFLPCAFRQSRAMGMLLICTSIFTMICMGWLAFMEVVLRHPGYESRMALELAFAVSCLAAMLARRLTPPRIVSGKYLRAGGLLMILFGALAFLENVRAVHFEGYIFVISLSLMAQGILTLLTLGGSGESASGQSAK
ncbi:MAG TPA: permease prefix domain 2-containing transporter [Terracidiphilus sp.]|nr:permease prefix domain 2-containing transporter [Terracidiphilus sp.]